MCWNESYGVAKKWGRFPALILRSAASGPAPRKSLILWGIAPLKTPENGLAVGFFQVGNDSLKTRVNIPPEG